MASGKGDNGSPAAEMTFWDHLDDLRAVLVRIAVVVGVLGIGAFIAMPWIFDHVIMAPCRPDFWLYGFLDTAGAGAEKPMHVEIVSVELTSQFLTHMSAACWTAFVVAFPIIIYLLWTFVAPALYDNEKRSMRKAFVLGNAMFYLGAAMGYGFVFPVCLRFLSSYSLSDTITPIVSLDSYMENFFTIVLLMGAAFELPLLAWLLGCMGLLHRSFFRRYRRHAIVGLMIVAALITPTGDPFTLFAVFIPIYALWEFSASLVKP